MEYGLRDPQACLYKILASAVLILVLMEYGLRARRHTLNYRTTLVLILVLMEYGLRAPIISDSEQWGIVLILVLMEYGLRGSNL